MPENKKKKSEDPSSFDPASEFENREELRDLPEETGGPVEPQPEGLDQFESVRLEPIELEAPIEKVFQPEAASAIENYAQEKERESQELQETLRLYESQFQQLKEELEEAKTKNRELLEKIAQQRTIEEVLRKEKRETEVKTQKEIWDLKNFYEERLNDAEKLDINLNDFNRQRDEWKKKVKEELNKIKLKEKEIENKYELLKSDSQALLDSKDKQILDLKKKIDAFELEQENLEERLRKSQSTQQVMISKKARLLETIRLVTQLLENLEDTQDPADFTGSKVPDPEQK